MVLNYNLVGCPWSKANTTAKPLAVILQIVIVHRSFSSPLKLTHFLYRIHDFVSTGLPLLGTVNVTVTTLSITKYQRKLKTFWGSVLLRTSCSSYSFVMMRVFNFKILFPYPAKFWISKLCRKNLEIQNFAGRIVNWKFKILQITVRLACHHNSSTLMP